MTFTEKQAKIAKALSENPKTLDDLSKELVMKEQVIKENLDKMIEKEVLEKKGNQYVLPKEISEQIGKKPENHKFLATMFIEGQSKQKKALENAHKDMIKRLKKDKVIRLLSIDEEDIEKQEDYYSVLFEVEFSAKNFEDVCYAVLNYGPSSVELIEPEEYTIDMTEAQGTLNDVATIMQAYMQEIAKKRIKGK